MRPSVLLLLPLVALALLAPASAEAGSYVVRSCVGAAGSAGAWAASASPLLAAYDACPQDNANPTATGMANRTIVQGTTAAVPGFSYAKHRFDAPPGATIGAVTFSAGFWVGADPSADGWRAGLWGVGADGSATKRWGDCSYGQCTGAAYAVGGPFTAAMAGASAAEFLLICARSSCPAAATADSTGGYYARAFFNTGDVAVRVDDATQPSLANAGGALWADGWHRGTEAVTFDADDNVGVAATSLAVDGWEHSRRVAACDYSHARPCPAAPGQSYALVTAGLADGRHDLAVYAADAAQNNAVATHSIDVDNHAPAAPAGITLTGGEGWRRDPGFSLAWTNPAGQAAPIVRARWTACRAIAHGGGCVSGEAARDGISSLDLRLPSPGDWTVRVGLEDAAGNADPAALSDPVHVRFDPSGPDRLGFAPRDPDDPRRIDAVIGDDVSGPATAAIELRRAGDEGAWIALPTLLADGRLSARVDDESLARGVYRGRIVAADGAGNQRVEDRYADGDRGAFTISLPARTPTRVTVIPAAHTSAYVAFGARRAVRGRLSTRSGTPLGRVALEVRAKAYSPLGVERHAGTVRTGDDGAFLYSAPAGPSRELRFYYHGSQVMGPSRGTQRLLVRAKVTLAVSRNRVRNGHSVIFTGRLLGGPVPPQGKLLNLQAFYRHRWRTFVTARSTSRGRFRARYRFEVSYGRVVYRFRAMARREAAYPYELGISPRVAVTVFGRR
jgi:hypothetical protein